MSGIEIGALCVVGAFLLFAAVRLFRGPVKLALRVLVNSALGFGAVWLLNLTAAVTGIRLGLNVSLRSSVRMSYKDASWRQTHRICVCILILFSRQVLVNP